VGSSAALAAPRCPELRKSAASVGIADPRASRAERANQHCASSSEVSCERRESRAAARRRRGAEVVFPLRATTTAADPERLRIACRCPGRTNEQTRFSSASERGRQRLQSAILASGASNQHCASSSEVSCERRESRAAARRRRGAEVLFPLRATTTAADPERDCASSSEDCSNIRNRLDFWVLTGM
jgi:hypothetical protein